MHPIFLVAKREFFQRIRQKMFWVMLFLGPLFFLVILIVPVGLSMDKKESNEILYVDASGVLDPSLYSDTQLQFIKSSQPLKESILLAKNQHYDGLIWLDKNGETWKCRYYKVGFFGLKSPDLLYLTIQQRITQYELSEKRNQDLPVISFSLGEVPSLGKTDETIGFVAGLFVAMLILVFVNQYSQMVLRGIVEEKQNRIAELILTSIKPLHFILGKVIGIASVAFLQMAIWFGSTGLIWLLLYKYFQLERFSNAQLSTTLRSTNDIAQSIEINSLLNAMSTLNYTGMLLGFLFYFIFGYLLFSALFAMIGIATGNDGDAHQLAMPIALPLALPLILLQSIAEAPHSSLARFLSVFPFTSPTTMMIRLPFGVPLSEILVSASVLVLSFLFTAFCAAKVYRMGVLMYGKKLGLGEIWKWVRSV